MTKKIVLGTAQFGLNYGISNKYGKLKFKEIFKILSYCYNKKIDFLDTATAYGSSEDDIGKFFKLTKKKFKVVTKYTFQNNKTIKEQLRKTFNSLGYYPYAILAHSKKDYLNKKFQIEVRKLKKKKIIKSFGVSLYSISELKTILKSKNKPDIIQIPVNLLDKRFLDKKVVENLKRKSIKIFARSIFLQGLFFKNKKFVIKNFKNIKGIYEKLGSIAKKENMNLGELSLNWVLNLKQIDKVVIAVDNLDHLKNNLDICKKKISKISINQIEKINSNNNIIIRPDLWKIK